MLDFPNNVTFTVYPPSYTSHFFLHQHKHVNAPKHDTEQQRWLVALHVGQMPIILANKGSTWYLLHHHAAPSQYVKNKNSKELDKNMIKSCLGLENIITACFPNLHFI